MRPFPIAPRAALMLILALGLPSAGLAGGHADPVLTDTYDIRFFGGAARDRVEKAYASPRLAKAKTAARDRLTALDKAADRLRAEAPGVRMERDPMSGGMEIVTSISAPLTAAEPGLDGASVVRGFLRDWTDIYGLNPEQIENLEVLGESQQKEGPRTVRLRQTVHGRPVFQSDTNAVLDADGRLLSLVGRLVPAIDEDTIPATFDLDARAALRIAAKSIGPEPTRLTRPATSELVYFPLSPGLVVPAWAQVLITRGVADWYTLVDARTGTLLWRKNIRWQAAGDRLPEALFNVYALEDGTPLDSPAPQSHGSLASEPRQPARRTTNQIESDESRVSVNPSTDPRPEGWLENDPAATPTTIGNNVDAYLDRDGDDRPGLRPTAQSRRGRKANSLPTFSAPAGPPPGTSDDQPEAGAEPHTYGLGAVTQLFYVVNWFHDQLYELGFQEPEGNFQKKNFVTQDDRKANDRILAGAQYAADRGVFNLASFSSPPDGNPGILRLALWDGPARDRDGSLDAQLVIHELVHGVTGRLLCNGAGLNWYPGRALAEGWSDFYALALLHASEDDDPDDSYSFGGYTAYKLGGDGSFDENYRFGMRRFPYSTVTGINPLTWKDVDPTQACQENCGDPKVPQSLIEWYRKGANDPHNAGELWALSLWQVRSHVIATLKDQKNATPVATGNSEMLHLVTSALKITPCDPSFIEARDALLEADCVLFECKHEEAIWKGFAARGLGNGASDSGGLATHYGIADSYDIPVFRVESLHILSRNLDYIVPNSPATLTIKLRNPWRLRTLTANAKLICANATVSGDSAVYSNVKGGATSDGVFALTPNVAAGASLGCRLELTPVDPDLPQKSIELGLRAGQSLGPGRPRDFPAALPPDKTIPDGNLLGDEFSLTIDEDLDVHSVELLIDRLDHPAVGDLTAMLRSPNGYGADLIYRLPEVSPDHGLLVLGSSGRPCFKNLLITTADGRRDFFRDKPDPDDDNCLIGSWAPSLESGDAWLNPARGQLDGFRGFYPKGRNTWTLFLTDAVPGGPGPAGTLRGWTLRITPVVYQP